MDVANRKLRHGQDWAKDEVNFHGKVGNQLMKQVVFRGVAVAIAFLGIWLIFRSTDLGLRAFSSVLQRVGTISGEAMHRAAYEGAIAAYRTTGAVLLGLGVLYALWPQKIELD